MTTEFNLSEKRKEDCIDGYYHEKDVKEFIRLLKEKGDLGSGISHKEIEKIFGVQIRNGQMLAGIKAGLRFMIREIDKLAGKSLT